MLTLRICAIEQHQVVVPPEQSQLRLSGTDTTGWPYRRRRAALESVLAARRLSAPWALCPSTTDPDTVREWLTWASVGMEGVVFKKLDDAYRLAVRRWLKYKVRETTEAIVGAVTGSQAPPSSLLLGRYNEARLQYMGRKTTLNRAADSTVAWLLTAAGPGHQWKGIAVFYSACCVGRGSSDAASQVRCHLSVAALADRKDQEHVPESDAAANCLGRLPVRQTERRLQHVDGVQMGGREVRAATPQVPVGEALVPPTARPGGLGAWSTTSPSTTASFLAKRTASLSAVRRPHAEVPRRRVSHAWSVRCAPR